MIGYHLCFIFALILIYLHPTDQVEYYAYKSMAEIKDEFRAEKNVDQSSDIVCDTLEVDQKRELCDLAMEYIIAQDHGDGFFGSFLERGTETDPSYTCTKMPVEELAIEKRMYFCYARRFKLYESDEVDQAEGFFISGSRGKVDRAFIFIPSLTEDGQVTPWAKLESVDSLANALNS